MSVPSRAEQRLLTPAEREAVEPTRYPGICELSREELIATAQRLREFRDRARDIARRQRREMRGKADPRGVAPARDDAGTQQKAQALTGALKRVNREITRLEAARARPSLAESARRALEMKRANRVRHHPSAGRTAGRGMRNQPNAGDTVRTDPREIGRVSQAVQAAQARRDAG